MVKSLGLLFISVALFLEAYGQVHADEPFKVGLSFPLSGANSEFGIAAKNGVELARSLHPQDFSKISFIYEDNEYDAKVAISSFQRVVKNHGAKLVFVWGSPTCMAVAPIAESSKTPLACLSGDPKPGLKYVFSFNSMAADYAAIAVADTKKRNPGKVGILYSAIPFLTNLTKAIVDSYPDKSRIVLNMSIDPSSRDLRAEVLKLKAANPDYLMLFILPPQVESVSKEMNLLKLKPYILGADTFADASVANASGGLLAGAAYVDMIIPARFREQYQEKYGNTSDLSFAYNAYQFAVMVATLFGDGKGATPEDVGQKMRGYRGGGEQPGGNIAFKESAELGQYFQFPIGVSVVPGAGAPSSKVVK